MQKAIVFRSATPITTMTRPRRLRRKTSS